MRASFLLIILAPALFVMGFTQQTRRQRRAFRPNRLVLHSSIDSSEPSDVSTDDESMLSTDVAPLVDAVPVDPVVVSLQKQLLKLASSTNRGFTATASQRKQAREIIFDLANYNPTPEPAWPFYNTTTTTLSEQGPSLAGKWTLVYTDAPDITGLDAGGPFATAKLARIGQECSAPYIRNVIEWKRPEWATYLPFTGTDTSRVLQKVVTEASASSDKPLLVNLKLAGFEVVGGSENDDEASLSLQEAVEQDGLVATWFQRNPIQLQGPLTAPFGQFEVLYLDDEFRIVKTGQNFVAVNTRNTPEESWF